VNNVDLKVGYGLPSGQRIIAKHSRDTLQIEKNDQEKTKQKHEWHKSSKSFCQNKVENILAHERQ
jgi:hypothetical protein